MLQCTLHACWTSGLYPQFFFYFILNFEGSLCVKCRQNSHSHDTFAHVQLITAHTAQIQSLITRTRVAQVVCLGVSKVVCHPSVMSHMLPHLPQNTSARSLSLSLIYITCPVSAHSGLEYETLRDPRRSGGFTESASPTSNGVSSVERLKSLAAQ